MDINKIKIAKVVTLLGVKEDHFKTNEIAISLELPLEKSTASFNAFVIK